MLVRDQQCLAAEGWLGSFCVSSSVETTMAADVGGAEQRKRESCGSVDSSVYFKIVQFPPRGAAKAAPAAEGQQPPSAAPALAGSALAAPALAGSALAGSALAGLALAGSALGLQTSSPAVMVIAKAAPPAHGTKAVLSQVASINQLAASGRAVMITVPRSAAANTLTVTPQPPPAPQPANIQIPPGELCGSVVCPQAVMEPNPSPGLQPACCRLQPDFFWTVSCRNAADPQ